MKRRTETKWKLTKRADRPGWVVRYMLAKSNRWREKQTGQSRKREAEVAARRIVAQAELDGDRDISGWNEFRARYETEHLSGQAPKTLEAFRTAANRLGELCCPEYVDDLDADRFSRFALKLREEGKSEATIQAYRDHLMSALKWAQMVNVISERPVPPRIARVKKGTKSRGRAITREEAERIAMQLPGIVGDEFAKRWAWNLEALWRSGFRIGETLELYWHPVSGKHFIENLDGDRPRIVIDADHEKGFAYRTIPISPDFVAMLRATPANRRFGTVFKWPLSRGDSQSTKTISKRISAAGKAAGVVVNSRADGERQYATAHDFRRAFGSRYAMKVMPIVLKELMRHSSIETTMSYYTGANADRIGDVLWGVEGAVLGDMLDSLFALGDTDGSKNAAFCGET